MTDAILQTIANSLQGLANAFTQFLPSLTTAMTAMADVNKGQTELVQEMKKDRNAEAVRKLKPDAPNVFDGSPDKVEGFLLELHFYFEAIGITDKDAKITYALSKIRGGTNNVATNWANIVRGAIYQKKSLEMPEEYFESWKSFVDAVKHHFVLHNMHEEAAVAIEKLEMGTMTCEEYTTIFNGYWTQLGELYGAYNVMQAYKRGLTKPLRDKVFALDPLPSNVQEWQAKADQMDRQWRRSRDYEKQIGGSSSSSSKRKEEPKKEAKREWVPRPYYQVPAAPKQNSAPVQRDLDTMDVDRLKREGRCFRCHEKGHIGRDCPKYAELARFTEDQE